MNEFYQINNKSIKNPFFYEDNHAIKYNGLINNFQFKCKGLNQKKNFIKVIKT